MAGSVFVLEAARDLEDSKRLVEEWSREGLPISASACQWYEIDKDQNGQWRTCPYIPQNGYGEIAVNLPEHTKPLPDAQAIEALSILEDQEDATIV